MFVGHYGASYAAKVVDRGIPLWVLFVAVQLLDVFWAVFVLLGIERVRIVPGITATNPLDLYYMPYTHSLVGALAWSALAGVAYRIWRGADAIRASAIVAVAVFSHWVLDLLVHRPDLPIVGDRMKVGLGLWNMPILALALEALFLFGGLFWYLRATRSGHPRGTTGFVIFSAALLGVQVITFFGAPPASGRAAALTALVAYVGTAAIAAWLERRRAPGR